MFKILTKRVKITNYCQNSVHALRENVTRRKNYTLHATKSEVKGCEC